MLIRGKDEDTHIFTLTMTPLLLLEIISSFSIITVSSVGVLARHRFSVTLAQSGYVTIKRLSLTECIQYCDVRVKCKSVTYRRLATECELHEQGLTTADGSPAPTNRDRRAVLFAREDWDTKSGTCSAVTCSGLQSCQPVSPRCAIEECERADDSVAARVLGNIQLLAANIVRVCNQGFIYPDGTRRKTLTCSTNGLWETAGDSYECEPVTCTNVMRTGSTMVEYDSFDLGSQHVIMIVCLFESDHGYTYISKDYLAYVTDLTRFHTRTDHVMLRHGRSGGSQWEGKVSVLSRYSDTYNVTVLANKHTGFSQQTTSADAAGSGSYIIVGFVPISFRQRSKTSQGYNFQSFDIEFINCDAVPSNQFVAFVDQPTTRVDRTCSNTETGIVRCAWLTRARPATVALPNAYFYRYAMFMGGCGTRFNELTIGSVGVTGAAIGLRFDL